MKNQKKIVPIAISTIVIIILSGFAYLIFNVYVFIIISGILTLISPCFFAYLNCKYHVIKRNMSFSEITSCIIFPIIITGFNNFIVETDRFKTLISANNYSGTISIQKFNIVTYIFSILIFVGIYNLSKRKLLKENRDD
ncbi:MAG: hypothetical protein RR806_01405 [Oscillospiraceae bacterium]